MDKIADINVRVPSQSLTLIALYETKYDDGNFAVLAEFSWPEGELEGDFSYPANYTEVNPISVNLPDEAYNLMQEGEFFLKDWSEREETAKALLESGVIIDTGSKVRAGYVKCPIVKLNVGKYKNEG
jgi:hypothetical protein